MNFDLSFYVSSDSMAVYWVAIAVALTGAFFIAAIAVKRLFNVTISKKHLLMFLAIFLLCLSILFNAMLSVYAMVGIEQYYISGEGDPDLAGDYGR